MTRGAASAATAAGLLATYVLTLAPDVTFWDAGEFVAAAHTLGIPHPPGTPLYVLLARAWAGLMPMLGTAAATNLLSAACTAAAGGLTAWLIAGSTRSPAAGMAAALAAGSMASVWMSATETEVYAAALLLAVAMLWAGDRAGTTGERRWTLLTAYLFALAGPLHLSALVAAPAAILLAAGTQDGRIRWRAAAALAGAATLAAGLGSAAWPVALAGLALLGAGAATGPDRRRGFATMLAIVAVAVLAASAFAVLLVRAQHDPAVNQGDPSTWEALVAHIARRQYAVAAPWPRQAPIWLQLANVLQYADWQVALGIAPGVTPSLWRTLPALFFAGLAISGARHHRRIDRRGWRAVLALMVSGSIGVALYLNLKAGPTIGHGILPPEVPHEPRERDYFFVLAFWSWGIWAGVGAWAAVARFGRAAAWAVVVVAATPIALNWRAMDRGREPEASLPRTVAQELLGAAPRGAVLFVWGDNDTYPLWYAQQVHGVRSDVSVITIPLLGAPWYRREAARRAGLALPDAAERFPGGSELLVALADGARAAGRPIAVAATVPPAVRSRLGSAWRMRGLAYVASDNGGEVPLATDVAAAESVARRLQPLLSMKLLPSVDHAPRAMRALLACPGLVARSGGREAVADSLDSLCNRR